MLRRLLPVAVLLFCCGIIGTGSASATALPIQDCTSTYGVIVVVDFGHWGGPLVRSCGSTPTTGYQLVNQDGLATTPVSRFPGFVCRIGYSGFNGGTRYSTDQACVNTPPASDSWSYWTASPTDTSWVYSPRGASESYPTGGTVQAWTFGGGSPSFTPDSVRAHTSASVGGSKSSGGGRTGTPAPAGSPAARSSSIGGPGGTGSSGESDTSHHRTASSGGLAGSGRPARSSAPAGGTASHAPSTYRIGGTLMAGSAGPSSSRRIVNAQPAPAAHSSGSGSYLPELAGAAIVLGFAGLTGFTVWQRKRTG
jgi:hypothetical protein